MKRILLALSVLLIGSTITKAQAVLTSWTFDDSTVSYPNPTPPWGGVGTISYLGSVTKASGTFSAGKGSGKRLSTTGYPKLTTDSSGITGTVFATSTAGRNSITVCYYIKLSKTASQAHSVKYSTDGGSTWTLFDMSAANASVSFTTGYFAMDYTNDVVIDTGNQSTTNWGLVKLDFSGIPAVNNCANFKFLITPVFAPGTSTYLPSGAASKYGSGGTYGFDSVTVSYVAAAPVTLKGFNASVVNNLTKLTWTSENELNVAGYQLEKSVDGKIFTQVSATNPSGKSTFTYTSNDFAPKGITYYRLKVTNMDGTFSYSNVISVNGKLTGTGVHIYPNPVFSNVTVSYNKVSGNASLLVYTTDGKFVTTSKLTEGSTQTTVDVSALKSGKYILTLNDGTEKQSTVLIKQ